MAPKYRHIREHELIHVRQQCGFGLYWSALLYFLLPLPVLFSGRWFVEREAYLVDIVAGAKTVEQAVDILWRSYGYPWPKLLMRKWFDEQIAKRK
jgi:hypothetical protein